MPVRADQLRAVVFDVDGTLYRQSPLRRAMFLRLLRMAAGHPIEGWQTFRTLQAYRHAQEHLRHGCDGDIATAQIAFASKRAKTEPASVMTRVQRWMEQEPLSTLPSCAYAGLPEFLAACQGAGLRLAALSDYPADAKLQALGIADHFELVLCAQAPEVNVFKPNPRGLQVVLEKMGVDRHECLYVGDRADVDAAAAAAAGMACVILTRDPATSARYTTVTSYPQLQHLLFGACHGACRDVLSVES